MSTSIEKEAVAEAADQEAGGDCTTMDTLLKSESKPSETLTSHVDPALVDRWLSQRTAV